MPLGHHEDSHDHYLEIRKTSGHILGLVTLCYPYSTSFQLHRSKDQIQEKFERYVPISLAELKQTNLKYIEIRQICGV